MSNRRFWLIVLAGLTLLTVLTGLAANKYLIDKRVELAADRLALLGTLRLDALARELDTARAELSFWSANDFLLEQQAWIVERWQEAIAAGRTPAAYLREMYIEGSAKPFGESLTEAASGYSELHQQLHPLATKFVTERGYYDFFLISPAGDIHYSVEKEDDFATNLVSGPYRDTGLAHVYRQVLAAAEKGAAEIGVSDLQPYAPSGGAPAMFLAKSMRDKDGILIGVIALQIPTERIQEIMHFDEGMGRTGETYLVGQDYLMRSDSRFAEDSTVLKLRVESDTAVRALQGEYGVDFTTDYRGVEVLSAYSNLPLGETSWAVMAEVDREEVLASAASERPILAGIMLFFYGLGIWSAWFIQRSEPAEDGIDSLASMELDSAREFLDG